MEHWIEEFVSPITAIPSFFYSPIKTFKNSISRIWHDLQPVARFLKSLTNHDTSRYFFLCNIMVIKIWTISLSALLFVRMIHRVLVLCSSHFGKCSYLNCILFHAFLNQQIWFFVVGNYGNSRQHYFKISII